MLAENNLYPPVSYRLPNRTAIVPLSEYGMSENTPCAVVYPVATTPVSIYCVPEVSMYSSSVLSSGTSEVFSGPAKR